MTDLAKAAENYAAALRLLEQGQRLRFFPVKLYCQVSFDESEAMKKETWDIAGPRANFVGRVSEEMVKLCTPIVMQAYDNVLKSSEMDVTVLRSFLQGDQVVSMPAKKRSKGVRS